MGSVLQPGQVNAVVGGHRVIHGALHKPRYNLPLPSQNNHQSASGNRALSVYVHFRQRVPAVRGSHEGKEWQCAHGGVGSGRVCARYVG